MSSSCFAVATNWSLMMSLKIYSGLQVQCPAHVAAHLSVYVRFSVVYSMNSEVEVNCSTL